MYATEVKFAAQSLDIMSVDHEAVALTGSVRPMLRVVCNTHAAEDSAIQGYLLCSTVQHCMHSPHRTSIQQ